MPSNLDALYSNAQASRRPSSLRRRPSSSRRRPSSLRRRPPSSRRLQEQQRAGCAAVDYAFELGALLNNVSVLACAQPCPRVQTCPALPTRSGVPSPAHAFRRRTPHKRWREEGRPAHSLKYHPVFSPVVV